MESTEFEQDNRPILDRTNVIKASGIFAICLAVMLVAVIVKFLLICNICVSRSILMYVCFCVVFIGINVALFVYLIASRSKLINKPKSLASVLAAMTLSFVACLYLEIINIYLMPVCLAAFVIAPLSKRRDAFSASLFCNILLLFTLLTQNFLANTTSAKVYYAIISMFAMGVFSGSVASYWVSNDTLRLHYILKGFALSLGSVAKIFILQMVFGLSVQDFWVVLPYLAVGALGQVVVALILQPLFETIFNLITNSRLVEFTDHNSPLIKRLISEAPGTFNHSLAVANFAEVCASAIGENPYLARACAYYHDIGKLVNSQYFKENQADYNPHDELLPEVSTDIIRSHTTEGYKLCMENRIPSEIADVTIQHHGTLPIYVFYSKAKELTDGEVSLEEYSYHGVTPVSKVAAIIMICDSGEAAIRSMVNPNGESVNTLLKKLINDRITAGQFNNCDISMRDLDRIRKTIIAAYGGQFHKRMAYPSGDKKTKA